MPAQSPAHDIYFSKSDCQYIFLPGTIQGSDCRTGTSIGACNHDGHIRVYMQDVIGKFREAMYERDWSNGTEKNVVAAAKIDSPLAVASLKLEQASIPLPETRQ